MYRIRINQNNVYKYYHLRTCNRIMSERTNLTFWTFLINRHNVQERCCTETIHRSTKMLPRLESVQLLSMRIYEPAHDLLQSVGFCYVNGLQQAHIWKAFLEEYQCHNLTRESPENGHSKTRMKTTYNRQTCYLPHHTAFLGTLAHTSMSKEENIQGSIGQQDKAKDE